MAFDMNGSGSSQSLLDPMQKKSSSLESQLAGFSRQIQQLQDDSQQLGTDSDSMIFRKQIQDKVARVQQIMKKLQLDLEDYKTMTVDFQKENERNTKYNALFSNFRDWMEKFGKTVQEIEQRKKMYLEVAEKHSSMGDLEAGAGG
jgi:DNA repair exonuclease SbcCD ATPase subunit